MIEEIKKIAKGAGEILLKYYKKNPEVEIKDDNSPVSEADKAANVYIVSKLSEIFPEIPVLSEEFEDDMSRLGKDVFIVDPLDGTKEFLAGIDGEFCVSIGFVKNGFPRLGVLYEPVFDKMYWAMEGKGAFFGNKLLKVSSVDDISKATLFMTRFFSNNSLEEFSKSFAKKKIVGSSLKAGLIANGVGEATLTFGYKKEWDVCAMDIIVREAGGKVSDFMGKRLLFNKENVSLPPHILSNAVLHDKLLELAKNL